MGNQKCLPPRWACAIEMPEQVILTGGIKTEYNVTVYNTEGFVEDWPHLKKGRSRHGCGHYVNTDKQMVSVITFKNINEKISY